MRHIATSAILIDHRAAVEEGLKRGCSNELFASLGVEKDAASRPCLLLPRREVGLKTNIHSL